MSDSAEQIFAGLIADRGGLQRFDETQRQICRRVSLLLSDDSSDFNASALNVLLGLLPEKAGAGEASYDLAKLTDEEFEALDRLTAKMCDAAMPPPLWTAPRWPKQSYRSLGITETVLLLDQCEAEIENARRKGQRTDLPVEDLELIRNAVVGLLSDVAQPEQVFCYLIENARYETRKEFREREEVERAAVNRIHDVLDNPAAEAKPAPPPAGPQNVYWGAFTAPRTSPFGDSHEARTGVDIPRGRW